MSDLGTRDTELDLQPVARKECEGRIRKSGCIALIVLPGLAGISALAHLAAPEQTGRLIDTLREKITNIFDSNLDSKPVPPSSTENPDSDASPEKTIKQIIQAGLEINGPGSLQEFLNIRIDGKTLYEATLHQFSHQPNQNKVACIVLDRDGKISVKPTHDINRGKGKPPQRLFREINGQSEQPFYIVGVKLPEGSDFQNIDIQLFGPEAKDYRIDAEESQVVQDEMIPGKVVVWDDTNNQNMFIYVNGTSQRDTGENRNSRALGLKIFHKNMGFLTIDGMFLNPKPNSSEKAE